MSQIMGDNDDEDGNDQVFTHHLEDGFILLPCDCIM
jgi:hypothetical protein